MDTSETSHWYLHPSFDSYWSTYGRCMEWLKLNHVTPIVPCLPAMNTIVSLDTDHLTERSSHEASHGSQQVLPDEEEEEEIDQGYLDFVTTTLKHQEEREKEKERKRKSSTNVTYIDITQLSTCKTSLAPTSSSTTSIDLRKRLQLVQWYGEDAEKVAKMEAALQVEYDQYCDKHSLLYFPHCPINMSSFFGKS